MIKTMLGYNEYYVLDLINIMQRLTSGTESKLTPNHNSYLQQKIPLDI
jgi:hypothetical protein